MTAIFIDWTIAARRVSERSFAQRVILRLLLAPVLVGALASAGPVCDFAAGAPRRDAGNKKLMSDPRTKALGDMPFDGRRMVFGGFDALLDS